MNEVLPGRLWYGSAIYAVAGHNQLRRLRISHVLNAAEEVPCAHPALFSYLHIRLKDIPTEDIGSYLEASNRWLDQHLRAGKNIYVHCMAGISRSSSLVLAYLM